MTIWYVYRLTAARFGGTKCVAVSFCCGKSRETIRLYKIFYITSRLGIQEKTEYVGCRMSGNAWCVDIIGKFLNTN